MAVNNTLAKAQPQGGVVEYQAGTETVSLSMEDIKRYLVSGGGNITDSEAFLFLNLCRHQHLNPFLREAYCIKYGNNPAQMVVGKDTFIKRARHRADFDGFKAGVVVQNRNGDVTEREGSFCAPGEQLLGGWAKVFIKGMSTPYYSAVDWREYAQKTKEGKLTSMWASKPTTMIRKVALSQALREAFPDDMGGLYEPEEINSVNMEDLPESPVIVQSVEKQPPQQKPQEAPKPQKQEPDVIDAEVVEPSEDDVAASLFG